MRLMETNSFRLILVVQFQQTDAAWAIVVLNRRKRRYRENFSCSSIVEKLDQTASNQTQIKHALCVLIVSLIKSGSRDAVLSHIGSVVHGSCYFFAVGDDGLNCMENKHSFHR
ncbi:hypothetical protein L2E82_28593 [Cichorium intybus]|uniref:Uncharacterized protein n=1 Tax=Cichorium intybus TaxID=13427 RepID=A0ACB9CW76_CICIN|nr:hypothetical protein L2E82_28593 [Cichorium intybus]